VWACGGTVGFGIRFEGTVYKPACRLLDAVSVVSTLVVSTSAVVSTLRPRPWWSRPCGLGLGGLGLGGLDLAVSAFAVVSTCAVSASAVVSTCAVSASEVSTCAVSTSAASSRPLQPRPQRRCHIALCLLCFLVFSFSSSRQSTSLFPTQRDITNGDIFLSTSRATNASYIPTELQRFLGHRTSVAPPTWLTASAQRIIGRYTRSWGTPKDCEG
jgi:hypothetical protein